MNRTETTTALLSSILDTAYSDINNSKIRTGFYDLVYRLKRVADTNDQEDFKSWIQQFCLKHPVNNLLQQDPYTNRSLRKPRGYSGDAELVDYFYRFNGPDTSTTYLGREIFAACMEYSACESVRWRANHIAETINKMYVNKGHKLDILSVASGHIRELHQIEDFDTKISSFVALDQDVVSNQLVRDTFKYENLTVLDKSLKYVLTGKLGDSNFDFVYSAGLYDYLDDKLATSVTTRLFDSVKPGGTLLIANFCPGLHERGYMEAFMDWYLIYRDEAQFISLLSGVNHQLKSDRVHTYRDDFCNVVYMAVTKKS